MLTTVVSFQGIADARTPAALETVTYVLAPRCHLCPGTEVSPMSWHCTQSIRGLESSAELPGDGRFEENGDVVHSAHEGPIRSNLQGRDVDFACSLESELQVLRIVNSADVRTLHPGPDDASVFNAPAKKRVPSA